MNSSSFAGFHFLPPSIHLPPVLRPVHGATVATAVGTASVAGAVASAGAVLQHAVAGDHAFPLATGQV